MQIYFYKQLIDNFVMYSCGHYYQNGVQFVSLNHYGTLKVK
jgi:hypothetical protein